VYEKRVKREQKIERLWCRFDEATTREEIWTEEGRVLSELVIIRNREHWGLHSTWWEWLVWEEGWGLEHELWTWDEWLVWEEGWGGEEELWTWDEWLVWEEGWGGEEELWTWDEWLVWEQGWGGEEELWTWDEWLVWEEGWHVEEQLWTWGELEDNCVDPAIEREQRKRRRWKLWRKLKGLFSHSDGSKCQYGPYHSPYGLNGARM